MKLGPALDAVLTPPASCGVVALLSSRREPDYPDGMRILRQQLTRRSLLSASMRAGVGIAALALAGCGNEAEPEPPRPDQVRANKQAQPAPARPIVQPADERSPRDQPGKQSPAQGRSSTTPSRPTPEEPTPESMPRPYRSSQSGMPGPNTRVTHQFADLAAVDSWDPHGARSAFAQSVHSLTYHRIGRWERSSSRLWEADLCEVPEILDLETWVFNLDPRARFQIDAEGEGRPATSEDVRLSIERLSSAGGFADATGEDPRRPADWATIRFQAFDQVTEYNDPFVLKIDRGEVHPALDMLLGPYSWIASAEAIEQAGVRWPEGSAGEPWTDGSGPYRLYGHGLERTTLVRSDRWWASEPPPDYWSAHRLARLDAIRVFSGSAHDLMQMYAAGDIDVAGSPLHDVQIDTLAAQFPEHQVYEVIGGRPLQLVTPRDPDPLGALSDPRIAMAINWSVNRPELARGVGAPVRLTPSGPVAPQVTELALPDDELRGYYGYRAPDAATRAAVADLVGAAGGPEQVAPLKLVVLDEVARALPGSDKVVLDMVRRTSGLTIELEYAARVAAMQRLLSGERFVLLRWGETPQSAVPIREWLRTQHTEGPGAWGAFADPELDQSLDDLRTQIDDQSLREFVPDLQRRWLLGSATGWIHDLAVPLQRVIVQPWFSPDARWLDFAWSGQHLADCGIRLRDGSGYPAARRQLPDSDSDADES